VIGPLSSLARLRAAIVVACLLSGQGLLAQARVSTAAGPLPVRVLQLNLCGSGFAVCYTGQAVARAGSVIRAQAPDVVTLNEVCAGDLAVLHRALAEAHHGGGVVDAFTPALDRRTGGPVRCRDGRPYGIGVVVWSPADLPGHAVRSGIYPMQDPRQPELRAWLCLTTASTTAGPLTACTTHLASGSPAVTLAQCRNLVTAVLPALLSQPGRPGLVVGGDLNLTADPSATSAAGAVVRPVPGRPLSSCVSPQATRREPAPSSGGPWPGDCGQADYRHADRAVQHVLTPNLVISAVGSISMDATTDHPALLVTLTRR
jgi:endonuclease/exonuclease/phosphatase family metal-dependent hydrolase